MSLQEQQKQKQSDISEGRTFERELTLKLMWYWVLVFGVLIIIIFYVYWLGFQVGYRAGQYEQLRLLTLFDNFPHPLINVSKNITNITGVG
jgi:magnesium-transporting ATPase (P-type)